MDRAPVKAPDTARIKARVVVEDVLRLPEGSRSQRTLIAIAGPPAAGKSTIAELVRDELEARGVATGLVPMDGYHLDNDELTKRGLLSRKGSPPTFDLPAFTKVVSQLRDEPNVSIALFDRAQDRTVPDAALILPEQRHVVVEGNYLLLDRAGWRDLHPCWNYAAFIEEHIDELSRRLIQRWLDHDLSHADATKKAEQNDLPNARLVLANVLKFDRKL